MEQTQPPNTSTKRSPTASSTPERHDGVSILPIPPALEFPYPTQAAESSRAISITEQSVTGSAALTNSPQELSRASTPAQPEQTPKSRPRPSVKSLRFVTEQPRQRQKPSPLGLRRRQTGTPIDAFNPTLWDSDSSSESSSSDENRPRKSRERSGSSLKKSNSTRLRDMGNTKQGDLAGNKPGKGRKYSRFAVGNEDYKTCGHVSRRDGRLRISLKETAKRGYLAKALGATLTRHLKPDGKEEGVVKPVSPVKEGSMSAKPEAPISVTFKPSPRISKAKHLNVPKLDIVIMVIGSRGDIQPFLRLGKVLKENHGHCVRIATHPAFKDFVEQDTGLDFFSVGGDPAELMAFMVKNPGLIPKAETIRAGEIAKRRESMYEMFQGFWRACINSTDDETDIANLKMMGDKNPFVADAIIANPPSFAHIHCAERLGIPLHLMFTFPMSPTQQFPHPLTKIKQTNVDAHYTNFMSYPLVEMMTWQGLGDLVNRFRVKTLGLEPISTLWAPGQLFRLRVPYTYMWSPALIPKPADWGPEINITGFVFLDLATSFKPPDELTKFLEEGPPPVYIGFGSIVVDDPDKFTELIFKAIKLSGVRALVSKGWGKLGGENTPENVLMLGNTPHDWLFPRVSAVVHHGGAGSTAIGLKCGKPTMIVPFFGDQPFWGAMVANAGAGAEPIPYKHLTAERLADAIEFLLTPEVQEAAAKLAQTIDVEGDGAMNAVESFHRSLPLKGNHSMRCAILEDRVAVWWYKDAHIRLSALAAEMLVRKRRIKWQDLRLIRHCDWNDFGGPGEPFTGSGAAIAGSITTAAKGIGRTPFRWARHVRKRRKSSIDKRKESGHHKHAFSSAKGSPSTGDPKGGTANGVDGRPTGDFELLKVNQLEDPKVASSTETVGENRSAAKKSMSSDNLARDLASDMRSGLAKTGGALAKAPMDLSLALAQGFHNAPRLYGDKTVRTPMRISGLKSGFRAAGHEFVYGQYDAWTGLVKQPYDGAKEEGAIGLLKGTGKGLGGWVLKNIAATWGLPAYSLKGIHKELTKGRQPTRFIRRVHIIDGQKRLTDLSKEEGKRIEEKVEHAWDIVRAIRTEVRIAKEKGIQGRIITVKAGREWKRYGVFENVEEAGRALEAAKQGRDFGDVFAHLNVEDEKVDATQDDMPTDPTKGKGKDHTT